MPRKPKPPAPQPPPRPQPEPDPRRPDRLLQPETRWQRFQRYVWDKKRG